MAAVAIKYKDHTVAEKFIKNGKTTEEAAYINASYKGILRLSPNNSDSLSLTQSVISSSKYIMFEDSVTELLKTNYISVSTSDGIILDMRISNEGVEYSSLNVLGGVKTDGIDIYYKNNFKFLLGDNTEMPKNYNAKAAVNNGSYKYEVLDTENINDFYYLCNTSANVRNFEFFNVNESIDKFVKENLLKLCGVPTGSIQFIPINPGLYKEIYLYNKKIDSKNNHNIGTISNNSLIRDYLVCDGTKYKNEDYPELAKVLYGTTVTYWERNSDGSFSEMKTYVNDYTKEYYFRVPDLRAQFIQSLNDLSITYANINNDKTGQWEIDSTVDSIKYVGNDNHYHYIVLDNFITGGKYTTLVDATYDNNTFKFNSTDGITSGVARPLSRIGNITAKNYGEVGRTWGTCNKCDKLTSNVWGTVPITYRLTQFGKKSSDVQPTKFAGMTCGYMLSVPPSYNYETRECNGSWVGKTSGTIPMEISSDKIDPDKLNYTKDDTIHSNKKYVDYNFTGTASNSANNVDISISKIIGYENTPEFYGVLPLIKI